MSDILQDKDTVKTVSNEQDIEQDTVQIDEEEERKKDKARYLG